MRQNAFRTSLKPTLTLTGTPAELEILNFLNHYEVAPIHYIKAGVKSSPAYVNKAIARLWQGHYIQVVPASIIPNALYRKRVWELRDRGRDLLKSHGYQVYRHDNDHFVHKLMRATIRFSFERPIPGVTLKTADEILAESPEATQKEKSPFKLSSGLIPDAPMFGLKAKRAIFFHGFEADRGTEPLTSHNYSRDSITQKIQRYTRYLASEEHAKRYGIPRVCILFITTSETRKQNILDLIRRQVPREHHKFFAVKHTSIFPDFPPPTAHMITEPWSRVEEPLDILQTIGVTSGYTASKGTDRAA